MFVAISFSAIGNRLAVTASVQVAHVSPTLVNAVSYTQEIETGEVPRGLYLLEG